MYLLTWNADENTIYAGIGGVVTTAETQVMSDEIIQLLQSIDSAGVAVDLDATRANRISDGALTEIEKLRFQCAQNGARLSVALVDPEEAMSPNVRAILEGAVHELMPLRAAS